MDKQNGLVDTNATLILDLKNDTTITIPASILVFDKEMKDKKISEFDGMILYPMRKNEHIVFLEAKNTRESGKAQKCLCNKFKRLNINYFEDNIFTVNQDAKLTASIDLI